MMTNIERWLGIVGDISGLIGKMEAQQFSDMNDKHGLVKINKKLYEALEIAQKAVEKAEME